MSEYEYASFVAYFHKINVRQIVMPLQLQDGGRYPIRYVPPMIYIKKIFLFLDIVVCIYV